jgi:hypothetical protein
MAIAIERLDGAVRDRGKAAGQAHEPFVFNACPTPRWAGRGRELRLRQTLLAAHGNPDVHCTSWSGQPVLGKLLQ